MTTAYSDMVRSLAKSGDAIVASMTPMMAHLQHMAIGVSGEANELFGGIILVEGRENFIEEMGDIEFYLEGLRQGLGIDREQTMRCEDPLNLDDAVPSHLDDATHILLYAGEVLDMIKKHTIYNKPMDVAVLIKAISRLEWALDNIRRDGPYGVIDRKEIIDANVAKLSVRYAGLKYSDTSAQLRADKLPTA